MTNLFLVHKRDERKGPTVEICPVCDGGGKLECFDKRRDENNERTCHGCGGKGWINPYREDAQK